MKYCIINISPPLLLHSSLQSSIVHCQLLYSYDSNDFPIFSTLMMTWNLILLAWIPWHTLILMPGYPCNQNQVSKKKNLVCLILIILVEILGHEFQFNVKSIWVSFKHFLHWIEHKVKKIKIINFLCVLKHWRDQTIRFPSINFYDIDVKRNYPSLVD